jgi:hypothetical protein
MDAINFLQVRSQRDQLLAQSDWTQMADSPLSAEQKEAWATYRQALRDLPSNVTEETKNWFEVVFPNRP